MLTTQETPQGYPYRDSPPGSPDEPSDLLVICKGLFAFTPETWLPEEHHVGFFQKNPGCLGIGNYTTQLCGDYYDGR